MHQQRDDFKILKIDVDACLDSFISAFAYLEQIADLNDCFFDGKLGDCSGFLELERFCDADGARGSLIFGLVETAGG
jgi:hypothetical protein